MDVVLRTQELENRFSSNQKTELNESKLDILPFQFQSAYLSSPLTDEDKMISENQCFNYYIFTPQGKKKHDKAIFLLHGLNERSWKKYLPWAEYLAQNTGKAVVLFPIAFHINRSAHNWLNPRAVQPWVAQRNQEFPGLQNATFVNVVLSSRLSQKPLRFFTSGMETVSDLLQLTKQIKNGLHPIFKEDASINLFGYSIGAMISEVLLLSNPNKLFSNSRLFMFCGGSVFTKMNANARDIVDSAASEQLQQYYTNDFWMNKIALPKLPVLDTCKKTFQSLIHSEILQNYRDNLVRQTKERIRAISLKADTVIPTSGIQAALGQCSDNILEEWDFPYAYSHQWPFPITLKAETTGINQSFRKVFNRVADYL
jgi:predicted esterase